jgi:glycosyltransferase involved in cell wall biosynthesis
VRQRFVEWGVPNERIIVQHFGTRAAEFLCRKKKRHNGIMTFGYIGPLAYHKGAHVLISAFKKLDSGSAKLVVYGNNQSDYGRKLMATDGLREVEFRGAYRHSDLQQILDNIDVMVVPPIWYDNSPQVVFEAFAAGVPVIGSDIGGIPDFVDHGVNGYLFAHGDAEELAKYMNALLADHTLLEKLSLNISPMITMKQHTVELSQLYERLVRERDILSTAN